jgi:hypothetical protein
MSNCNVDFPPHKHDDQGRQNGSRREEEPRIPAFGLFGKISSLPVLRSILKEAGTGSVKAKGKG